MSFPVYDFLRRRAEVGPERMAMEDLVTGETVTYLQFHLRAGRAAALLGELGVGDDDRVAILCRNRIEFFELLFACARLGTILVPLNWRMPAAELGPLMSDSGSTVLLYGAEDTEVAAELAGQVPTALALDDGGPDGYAARRDACEPAMGREVWPSDDTWYLLYTSGTTGLPKAVIQTFGMCFANHLNIGQEMGLRADDTTPCFLPLFHTAGINLLALPAFILGARVVIMPGFEPERLIRLLAAAEVDAVFAVPAVYRALSLNPDFEALDFSRVRSWACGGAPMPDLLFEQFAARGATVRNGMGMTETGPAAFLMDAANAHRKIGSVGKPMIMSAVRIVGEDGQDVAPGGTGELWFAGLGVTPGYFNKPEVTAETITEDGWLRSGDLARQDEEGYYYIAGRIKEMYISGGENVYPAEVENQLAEHPDILEAAIIGVPDARWGEVGCAFLLARPGRTIPDGAVLEQFLRGRVAAYKIPKSFHVLEEFPRTAAGKVQKHLLPRP